MLLIKAAQVPAHCQMFLGQKGFKRGKEEDSLTRKRKRQEYSAMII